MDAPRFDHLTKTLAGPGSRRRLLRGVLAAPLATALTGRASAAHERGARARGDRCGLNGQVCGDVVGVACCPPFTCATSLGLISTCVLACQNDDQCRRQHPAYQIACQANALICPFIKGGKCCVAKSCLFDGDCERPYTCQSGLCQR